MLKAESITNYKNVTMLQSDTPYILIFVQPDQYYYDMEIGRFNFYTKEGYILSPNGHRKEYKQFNSLMNHIFKIDECFGWYPHIVEACKQAGQNEINKDKKEVEQRETERANNKAIDILNHMKQRNEIVINAIKKLCNGLNKNEIIELIKRDTKTKENTIIESILNEILLVLSEPETTEIDQQTENTTNYIVGNKSFSTYQEAETYCLQSDFEPSIMIQVIEGITPDKQETTTEPIIYHLYKNTFNTYNEAFDYACKNIIHVHMILPSNANITNERLQQLQEQYTFNKTNMSYDDMLEFYNHLLTIPETLDQQETIYKLKSMIERYENKQIRIQQEKDKQRKQAETIDLILKDMYKQGMTKKEYENMVIYYLNNEKIYSWIGGITIEKMYYDILEVYNKYFNTHVIKNKIS